MTESPKSPMESFINRELSLLEFNQRVLALATDPSLPLLERLRFLCISSSNIDEFFEIRVAGLKQLAELGTPVEEQLESIRGRAAALIADQYVCLNSQLLPELAATGVRLQSRDVWTAEDRAWLEQHFHNEVEPVLTPLGLDPARPFPRIQNKSLNFVVRLEGKDAFGRDTDLAIVQVPRSLPRVVRVPNGASGITLVLLSNIVSEFIPLLFPGMEVHGCYAFRVTRNSDLFVDEEEIDDLRRALEGELAHRRYGASVRLETSVDCPDDIADFLLKEFTLGADDLYRVSGPVNLNRLSVIYELAGRSDLKYPLFTPALPEQLSSGADLFEQLRVRDVPAAPTLPELRAGDGLPAPGGRRPAGAGHQADAVSHRHGIAHRGRTGQRPPTTARTSPPSSSCARASMRRRTSTWPPACRKPACT